MSLIRNASVVAVLVLGSRILGFTRDAAVAALFGAGAVADAAVAGLALPQLSRRLLGEGALNGAVVPAALRAERDGGPDAVRRLAFGAVLLQFGIGMMLAALLYVFMPQAIRLLAPGFAPGETRFADAVWIGQLTVVCLPLMAVSGVLAALANAAGRTRLPSLSPLMGNVGVLAVLFLALASAAVGAETPAGARIALDWLAAATLAGAAVQFAVQCAAVAGCRFAPRLPSNIAELWNGLRAAAPTLLGAVPSLLSAALPPLRFIIAGAVASGVPGAVAALFYASRLVELPLGVIGAVAGAVLLPALVGTGRTEAASRGLEATITLALPAALGLIVLAEPIVTVLFRHGAFDAAAVAATSEALALLALALPVQAMEKILAAIAFAHGSGRLATAAGLAALAVGGVSGFALAGPLGLVGPALGLLVSSLVGAGLLAGGLMRRGLLPVDATLRRRLPRLLPAALVMALASFFAGHLLAGPLERGGAVGFGVLATIVALAVALYAGVAQLAGAVDLKELKRALRGG
ncbi:polysaccharide biosynthesis C-terminal domain-containing protein [Ancylobacter sp. 6x-1]|uniref:Polysaccharide biosynthesis C-terminal domain-containing protein n=1 Tax=Ancylobacter crimeensis TaxID=2579147 RepID=A0ABT0DDH9_9HYPH|nr:lipid II flippase MurJ [Ancylobacter crimeensis]MCK0198003.1 polysaccharide biosynthesis C-terminal domain-containing protein [Ancylobacter crimeensis]